jgi:hypothetical protein
MIIGNFKVMSAMESLQHHGNKLEVVHSGHRSTVGTIPKIVRIPADNCHTILNEALKMNYVCRHVVSRMLLVRKSAMKMLDVFSNVTSNDSLLI